ncbi:MAG: TonB-dependent receptor, partial [Acidobacteriota bacterium]
IVADTLTWARGRHTFKGGMSFNAYQNNTKYDFYINGDFYFSGEGGGIGSGNDMADFLLGLPDEFLQFPLAPSDIRSKYFSGFFQDEWRLARNLVLTLGVRYEYSSPKLDTRGRSFSLGLGRQSQVFTKAPPGLLFPGDPNAPKGANLPDKNDWAPRIGFAWSPTAKTSIRGGAGMFYDILKAEDNLQFNGQAPFFGFVDLYFDPPSRNPTAPLNIMSQPFVAADQPNPFPSKPPAKDIDFGKEGFLPVGGGGVYFVDPHLRTPYALQYNLSVQRELLHGMVLDVAYVGSGSRKLTGLVDANPFILGTTRRIFNAQPGIASAASFSYLDEFRNVGNGNYNSLQVGLTQRARQVPVLGKVEFLQLSYTWQKSIDTMSGFRERSSRVPYYNPKQFRAASDFDLTQNFVLSAAWELPFNRWGGPKGLLGGWTLYPVLTLHTGFTLDVYSQISRSRTRTGPSAAGDPNMVRADLIKANVEVYDPHREQTIANRSGNFYFDRTAFSTARYSAATYDAVNNPALRTYGTLGRNAFRGPGRVNLDLALAKFFPIWKERIKGEFRAEAFNLANHAQWGSPNTNISSAQFGQITSTLDPRIVQLALRIRF